MGIACCRLRDGGGKSFSNNKCDKPAGAGKRQGATAAFPKSGGASYFRFARFNTFPLYYLRAWHRLCRKGMIVRYTYSWQGNSVTLSKNRLTIVTMGVVTCMLHQFVEGHFMSGTPL